MRRDSLLERLTGREYLVEVVRVLIVDEGDLDFSTSNFLGRSNAELTIPSDLSFPQTTSS